MQSASYDRAQRMALAADEAGALDIKILAIGDLLPVCDYFLICHSRSPLHSTAICDKIEERMHEEKLHPHHREGNNTGEWVILDFLDVVVHVFSETAREFYGLERLWSDAAVVPLELVTPHVETGLTGGF